VSIADAPRIMVHSVVDARASCFTTARVLIFLLYCVHTFQYNAILHG
jgi:hypothetical protein